MVQIMKKVVRVLFGIGVITQLLLIFVYVVNGTMILPIWMNLLGLYLCLLASIGYTVVAGYHMSRAHALQVAPKHILTLQKQDYYTIGLVVLIILPDNLEWSSRLFILFAFVIGRFIVKPYYDLF